MACKQGSHVPGPKLFTPKSYYLSSESCHSPLSLNISNWRILPSTLSSGSLVPCQVSLVMFLFLVGQMAEGMLTITLHELRGPFFFPLFMFCPLHCLSRLSSIFSCTEFSWFCLVYSVLLEVPPPRFSFVLWLFSHFLVGSGQMRGTKHWFF